MNTSARTLAPAHGTLKDASLDRLACLARHWAWADEAMTRFERELANGWEYGEDLSADHPFGSYYHWCALLSGFSEAALEDALLPPAQLAGIRQDLEASIHDLRTCRRILVAIPESLEEHPRVVDLLRDEERLGRLRRLHQAFGDAIRREHMERQIDAIDP